MKYRVHIPSETKAKLVELRKEYQALVELQAKNPKEYHAKKRKLREEAALDEWQDIKRTTQQLRLIWLLSISVILSFPTTVLLYSSGSHTHYFSMVDNLVGIAYPNTGGASSDTHPTIPIYI